MILALLLLVGCPDEPTPLSPAAPIWVEARKVADGKPVRVHAPGETVMPAVEGLVIQQVSSGDDGTAVWEVSGKAGSYILEVPGAGGLVPVYVDIGVDGPTGGKMADLATPPPSPPPVWPYVLAGVVGLGTLIAAALAAWKRWNPLDHCHRARVRVAHRLDLRARQQKTHRDARCKKCSCGAVDHEPQ